MRYSYVYIGPYFQCKNELISEQEIYSSCPKLTCSWHKLILNSKYCSECGTQVSPLTLDVKKHKVHYSDLLNKLGNKLHCPINHSNHKGEENIWIPNSFNHDVYDHWFQKIDRENISIEMKKFETTFAKSRKILEKSYGSKNVITLYGVLNYYV